jgi:hypothetical protein
MVFLNWMFCKSFDGVFELPLLRNAQKRNGTKRAKTNRRLPHLFSGFPPDGRYFLILSPLGLQATSNKEKKKGKKKKEKGAAFASRPLSVASLGSQSCRLDEPSCE